MFVRLEAAKAVLLDKETRLKYDQWRSGGFQRVISFKEWLAIQSKVHSVSVGLHINYYYSALLCWWVVHLGPPSVVATKRCSLYLTYPPPPSVYPLYT